MAIEGCVRFYLSRAGGLLLDMKDSFGDVCDGNSVMSDGSMRLRLTVF